MAADSKDIELRIRARDYSQKTLDQVTGALESLSKAQADQLSAAKRGEVGSKALEESYKKLESAAQALIAQHALTKTFETQARALEESKQRTEAARQAQVDYAKSLGDVDARTKVQITTIKSLASAAAAAERAQLRAQDRVAGTSEKLAQYGIASDKVGKAQARIASAIGDVNGLLERQDTAMQNLGDDAKAFASAAKFAEQLAAAQRAVRESQVSGTWNKLLDEREAKLRAVAQATAELAAKEKAAEAQAAASMAVREKQLGVDMQFEQEQRKIAAAAEREAKAMREQRAAMSAAADQADALVKNYSTLARATASLSSNPLADQVNAIRAPGDAAMKTMDGLAASIAKIEKLAGEATGPIKGYKAALNEVEAAQRSLSNIAGQVDGFNRQMAAVRNAREQYVAARSAVRDLADQLRSGAGAPELVQQMNRAQTALASAAEAMRKQTTIAGAMRTALRSAGVDTSSLAAAEVGLVAQAQRAVGATNTLTAAFEKHGAAVESAGTKTTKFFGEGGRTTLSYMQRMRGEVLSLAAGYVGMSAAVNLAKSTLDAYRSSQAIESRLGVMVGNDAVKIKAEWDYLMGQAKRLSFEFEAVAGAYAKFGIAAQASGSSLQETRFIFEQIATGARGAKMSTEEFEGVLKAVEQMMSKGTIQAEELRGQLGDRLPGAMALAARGAGKTVQEFSKMMEAGAVGSEYVINLAREIGKTYGVMSDGTKTLRDADADFKNAAYKFKLALGESGFTAAYTEFLTKLTEILSSEQGTKLAQQLSSGFTGVVKILGWCAEHVDLLKLAFLAFIGVNIVGSLATSGVAIVAFAGHLRGLGAVVTAVTGFLTLMPAAAAAVGTAAGMSAGGVGVLTRAVALLTIGLKAMARAVPFVGAALIAYELYDNFIAKKPAAAKAGGATAGAATADPGTGGNNEDATIKALKKTLEADDAKLAKVDKSSRMKGAKGELQARKDIISEQYDALDANAKANIKTSSKLSENLIEIDKRRQKAMLVETQKFNNEQAKSGAGAANTRVSLAREVADEIGRIEDDLAKRETMQDPTSSFDARLQARLEAIAHEYDKLRRKIDKMGAFDKAGSAKAGAQLDEFIKQRQGVEKVKVSQEELTRLEKDLNDTLGLRTAKLAAIQAQYEAGVLTQGEMRQKTQDVNDVFGIGIETAADKLALFAESIRALLDPKEYESLVARLSTIRVGNNPQRQNTVALKDDSEKNLNEALAQRQVLLDDIEQKKRLLMVTDAEAVAKTNEVNGQFRGIILAHAQELINYLNVIRTPETAAAVDAQIAKLQSLKLETANASQAYTELQKAAADSFLNGAMTAIDAMAQSMAGFLTQQKSAKDMFSEMGKASLMFFAQFMRDIAMAIIKQQILNAMKNSGNPYLMAAGAAMGAATKHTGGVVGQSSGNSKRVDSSIFAGAQRLHGGGIPGLQADEVPTILQKSEEVLTRDDPRHILNGGGGGGGGGGSNRFVLVDDRSKVAEAMATSEGENVTMVHLKRNISTIKQWVK